MLWKVRPATNSKHWYTLVFVCFSSPLSVCGSLCVTRSQCQHLISAICKWTGPGPEGQNINWRQNNSTMVNFCERKGSKPAQVHVYLPFCASVVILGRCLCVWWAESGCNGLEISITAKSLDFFLQSLVLSQRFLNHILFDTSNRILHETPDSNIWFRPAWNGKPLPGG